MTEITRESFGEFAGLVEEFCGECTLPVVDDWEIHPGATDGRWAVVDVRTGRVAAEFDDIGDAVEYAERNDD